MTNNLRFPPPPRHSAEDDVLDLLGPAWSKMTPEQRRQYAGPITLAREAAEDAAAAAVADGVTLDAVAELLDVALRFPGTVRYEGLRYVAEKWCATDGAVTLATMLQTAPDDLLGAVVLPFTVPQSTPRAGAFALRVG